MTRYIIEHRRKDGSWGRYWKAAGPYARYSTAVSHATDAVGHRGIRIVDITTGRIVAAETRWIDDREHHRLLNGMARYLRGSTLRVP